MVYISTAIVTDQNDQPVALIGIATDITERKKNEEELIAAKERAEEKGGSVRFGYSKSSDSITFYIIDTCIGIPAEFKSKVFERFRKVDLHDRTDFEGTGLGLAITKELVKMLNGKIWFDSELARGSTFFVSIPY